MAVSRTVLGAWQVGLNTINITVADTGDGGLARSHICTGTGLTPCHIRSDTATVGPRLPFRSRMHAYTNAYMSSRDLRLVRLPERPLVRDQHLAGPSRAGNRRGTLSGWVGGFAGCACGQGRAGRASGTERAAVCGAVDGLEGAVGPVLRLVRHRHQISQVLPAQWPPPFGGFPPPPVSQVLTSTPGALDCPENMLQVRAPMPRQNHAILCDAMRSEAMRCAAMRSTQCECTVRFECRDKQGDLALPGSTKELLECDKRAVRNAMQCDAMRPAMPIPTEPAAQRPPLRGRGAP
jgi:hypothetical protein